MPARSQGVAGQENTYDLAAVLDWLENTGTGCTLQTPQLIERIAALREGLDEPPAPPAADAVGRHREISLLLARLLDRAAVSCGADLVLGHNLAPEDALDVLELMLYGLNNAAAEDLGLADPKSWEVVEIEPNQLNLISERGRALARRIAAEAKRQELEEV